MVAKIKSGKSLIGALNYNEHKVKAGKAELIAAQSYAKDLPLLSFDDKLFRLKDLAARNQRTKTNTVHLSLNFDVSEQLTREMMIEVADNYMGKIGFAYQPYLIYQHYDAGHPHIHILTTNIEPDGNRISLHNIGLHKSEPARKAIEIEFGLVQAESKKEIKLQSKDVQLMPLDYGKTDTKRALTNIVNQVTQSYKFTSLAEFNVILSLYNLSADRGAKETVMFDKGGLRYWPLDNTGQKIGVPIKASAIYKKPTLKLLEDRFRLNEYLRKPFKDRLKAVIDKAILKASDRDQFTDELKKSEVTVLFRQNGEGRVYGVTYIDQYNKAVFNGSDLGKAYSAAAIVEALKQNSHRGNSGSSTETEKELQNSGTIGIEFNPTHSRSLLDDLLSPTDNSGAQNLFERQKKKKRKKLNL